MVEAGTGWNDFFMAQVGATAALAGLVVVAISINLQRILSFPQLPGRAAEMLILLVGALLACSFALLPGQTPEVFGGEILGAGFLMTATPIVIQARQLPLMKTQPLTWWLWRHLIGLCASVPVLIGGILLVGGARSGLYWLAAGIMATLAATVWNAWVLLVEILR
jgi:modulator of FtsH protease